MTGGMPSAPVAVERLSIHQAKPLLAQHYGTAPENVEITIRG